MNIAKNFKSVEFFNTYLDNTFSILVDHKKDIYKNISKFEFESGILSEDARKKIAKHFTNFKTRTYFFVSLPQIRTFLSMLDDDLRLFEQEKVTNQLKKHTESVVAYAVVDFVIGLTKLTLSDDDYCLPDDVVTTAKGLKERLGKYLPNAK